MQFASLGTVVLVVWPVSMATTQQEELEQFACRVQAVSPPLGQALGLTAQVRQGLAVYDVCTRSC